MAGAIYQVRCTLAEWGVGRAPRLILLLILALNPMVIYYGGNGMSEGLYLFTLLATCRYLLRWMHDDHLGSLVYAGTALGCCYLARNEAVAPAILGGALVLGISYARQTSSRLERRWNAITDMTIFLMPFVTAFVAWAFTSYVITGQPFQQFTSVYGNTSQEQLLQHQVLHARLLTDLHAVFFLAPTIPIVLILAIDLATRRKDYGLLAPLAVVGGGLAFDLASYAANTIQPFYRYFITAVPLEVLLVGGLFATAPVLIGRARPATPAWSRGRRQLMGAVAVLVALVLLIPSAVTTVMGMRNSTLSGDEETQFLGFIFHHKLTTADKLARDQYPAMLTITDYLQDQHLADGQIVVDNFSGCIPQVITMSANPKIFVIPNDRDFQRILADPLTFGAHYILDVDPAGAGSLTAPNSTYPTLWKTGGGFATVAHKFPAAGLCPDFKLYRVTGHPNQAN